MTRVYVVMGRVNYEPSDCLLVAPSLDAAKSAAHRLFSGRVPEWVDDLGCDDGDPISICGKAGMYDRLEIERHTLAE